MTGIRSGYLVAAVLSVGLLAGVAAVANKTPESFENFTAEEIYKRGEYELENSAQAKGRGEILHRGRAALSLFRMGQAGADHAGLFPITAPATEGGARPPSGSSTPIRAMRTRPMPNTCWRSAITTRSTRSAATT